MSLTSRCRAEHRTLSDPVLQASQQEMARRKTTKPSPSFAWTQMFSCSSKYMKGTCGNGVDDLVRRLYAINAQRACERMHTRVVAQDDMVHGGGP